MDATQHEMAIEEAERLLKALTQARTLQFHMMPDKARAYERSARCRLDTLANLMGMQIKGFEDA